MSNSNGSKRNSDRLVPVTIAAICLLLLGGAIIVWGYLKQVEYYRNADQHSYEYAGNTYAPKTDSCIRLAPVNQFDCLSEASNEYRQYRRDEQDLAAQKTSAIWSYLMGSSAVLGMILSAFGVFLVWTTFMATREANKIADQAVSEARNATKASQDAVVVTREIGEKQVRAYLGIDTIRIEPLKIGNTPTIRMTNKNYGQTPAYEVHAWCETAYAENFDSIIKVEEKFEKTLGVLDPQQTITFCPEAKFVITDELMSKINDGTVIIFFHGCIRYRDAFGYIRYTNFRFYRDKDIGSTGVALNFAMGEDIIST